jgi:NADH dehydrogenase
MSDELIKTGRIVTVFGGSGFVGRHVVRALARQGWRIRVASRRPDLAFHLQPLGRVGQIHAVQANLRYPESVAAALRGSEAVVNLVAVLTERGTQNFGALHVRGARTVARAAADADISNVVHVSAIGADPQSASLYARTKGEGEAEVLAACPDAVIMRPSIIFGPEDSFFNRFAALARMSPALPLFGGGETKFQPVYVGDVAEAIARALEGRAQTGAAYELGGPEVKTFRELMQYVCDVIGRRRLLLPLPFAAGEAMAFGTELADSLSLGLFPKMLLTTRDQMKLLAVDNVVSEQAVAEFRTLQGLGIHPEAIESIVPTYLARFRKAGQFESHKAA